MRLKRANTGVRACALVSFVALAATALTPAPALALPEGRVYEMVSPSYKGGSDVAGLEAIAPDGEGVVFSSSGAFADGLSSQEGFSLYLARRNVSTGWSTTSLSSPPTFGNAGDFSATLQYSLANGSLEATTAGVPVSGNVFVLHRSDVPDTAASWEVAGGLVLNLLDGEPGQLGSYEGASADLCHIMIGDVNGPLLPEAENTTHQLYDLAAAPAGGCRGDGSRPLRLVAVKNGPGEPEVINRSCEVNPGSLRSPSTQPSSFNAVAAGGEEIFFTTSVEDCAGTHGRIVFYQLFVRLGGGRTLEVSRPESEAVACGEEVPCPGAKKRASANFVGASEDGSRVFFTTAASLSSDDKDTQNDLYMAEIVCPESKPECSPAAKEVKGPELVSKDEAHEAEPADVQGVVRVAPDGEHVYFVALGALSGANAEGQAPVKGAENMYVYDTQNRGLAFIADLCSGPALSGVVKDRRCPRDLNEIEVGRNDTGLWGTGPLAQSNANGGFLVFSSYARLREDDTDNAKDVYRYDAGTGTLDRVSLGEAGYDANGNNSSFDASIPASNPQAPEVKWEHEMHTRAISEDGSRIVFTSSEPLSPDATNGLANVYEWHQEPGELGEGHVSLVSSGSSLTDDLDAVISASGRDIFFVTRAQLVRQDTDENTDIYDARLEGGFPAAPAERQRCSGDACQGPLTNPAPLLVPGSVSQAPGQNFAAPASKPVVKVKPKPKKKKHKRKTKAKKAANKRRAK